ncbi:hypothetical protein F5B22DRAFT_651503 [Xylaria bambusicola]|uniref:uncharacterized protein n=1 Tax=Xylaria bambusicola TaxID=326684 RepID=UPI0020075EE6|nr:uncharacterized protein F5B22DRAFT_651503 [Xylaria bambusicola]KAI0505705.1 hypothetical protein F5B22DRAFT_651503 [Xylaria bambusicola]
MWILENEGEALGHRRLWLRPGKRYLFGRTVAEPGQLAIQGPGAERVSRKHVTITVDPVVEGRAEVVGSRSKVTVEDLGSKGGTKVNGHKYRSETCTLSEDENTIQMGSFPPMFRITWLPVVFSFSFTSNQLRANPFARLRESLEQLDIKLLSDYDIRLTTHVVSKKRNTPKGLQALINNKYIVDDGFIDAIVDVASAAAPTHEAVPCLLEQDFDANWPDPLHFVPPPGEEPVPRQPELFAPNSARTELFDGYTFVFYEKKQYDSLLAPITNGKGKALLNVVVAGETQIDDFVRFVKSVAGEKGLGEFEDGSEGKGVVVVKWMPSSDENADWFADFYRSISLRLDHRLIDQKDFLDAILNVDASSLRRPLEFESPPASSQVEQPPSSTQQQPMEVEPQDTTQQSSGRASRRRGRGPVKSRFQGFAVSLVEDDSPDSTAPIAVDVNDNHQASIEPSEEGLFVSQSMPDSEPQDTTPANQPSQQSWRKRPASPLPEPGDILDNLAPTAAQVKRRRIAAGEDPFPRRQPSPISVEKPIITAKQPKIKKEIDILEVARQHREEAEKQAKLEQEQFEKAPEDLDLAEIRRLHIEEPMPLREAPQMRTREQDIADGRWDPAWNGRKNFKKFRQRGALQGRTVEKIIVALEEVKTKGFGIGDDYWLEDSTSQQQRSRQHDRSLSNTQSHRQATTSVTEDSRTGDKNIKNLRPVDSSDDDSVSMGDGKENEGHGDSDDDIVITSSSRPRITRASVNTTQSQARGATQSSMDKANPSRRTGKRPAAEPPAKEKPPKRAKGRVVKASDDESDDDDLRFRFTRRRA